MILVNSPKTVLTFHSSGTGRHRIAAGAAAGPVIAWGTANRDGGKPTRRSEDPC